MYWIRAATILVVTGLGAVCADAASANPLGVELRSLLTTHPQIKAQEKALESAGREINKARADYLPQVSVSGDIGPERVDSPAQRSRTGIPDKEWMRTRNTAGVTVTQNLFDGLATTSATRSARFSREVAALTLEGTRQNVLFEGVSAYIDVLRQKRLVELARDNETTIQRQLSLEDERVARGSGIAVDVLQAKSRLQIAKERRVTFEGAFQDAISRYQQVFDRAPEVDRMRDPVPPIEALPVDLTTAEDIARTSNPAVGSSNATVEVARERRRSVRAEYFPTVDLVGSANYEKHQDATLGTRRDYSLLLQATWDLFTGFSTRASAAQAAFDYRASRDNHEFVIRRVIEQTRVAWQSLVTTRERLELLENAINIASEVFESRRKLREAGKETVINVLDAENEIIDARINFTAASYDERLAVYQVLLAMGRLQPGYLNLETAMVDDEPMPSEDSPAPADDANR